MGDTFSSKKLINSINIPSILHPGSSKIKLFFLWAACILVVLPNLPLHITKKWNPSILRKISAFLPNLPSKSFELLLKIP